MEDIRKLKQNIERGAQIYHYNGVYKSKIFVEKLSVSETIKPGEVRDEARQKGGGVPGHGGSYDLSG